MSHREWLRSGLTSNTSSLTGPNFKLPNYQTLVTSISFSTVYLIGICNQSNIVEQLSAFSPRETTVFSMHSILHYWHFP